MFLNFSIRSFYSNGDRNVWWLLFLHEVGETWPEDKNRNVGDLKKVEHIRSYHSSLFSLHKSRENSVNYLNLINLMLNVLPWADTQRALHIWKLVYHKIKAKLSEFTSNSFTWTRNLHSVPQFPHLYNRVGNKSYFREVF